MGGMQRVAAMVAACVACGGAPTRLDRRAVRTVSITSRVAHEPLTGRLFLFLADGRAPKEPRLIVGDMLEVMAIADPADPYAPMFGMDVDRMTTGTPIVMREPRGYPFATLADVPDGDYVAQAVFDRYTQVVRADGKRLWVHFDRGEGHQPQIAPGNLYSRPAHVRIRKGEPIDLALELTQVIPEIPVEPDTRFVKRIKIKSELLSKFWGHPIEVGATIVLPSTYDARQAAFPVLYHQGHFDEADAFVRPDERPTVPANAPPRKAAWIAHEQLEWDYWNGDTAPQMIVVTFQHPTPFYDSSYLINSPNVGPYGDMVMTELIPQVESQFRIIKQPWARVLDGGSIGGWTAAALQIYHPEFFGGVWSGCPDPVDFHHFYMIDLYDDENAFLVHERWVDGERLFSRAIDGTPYNTTRRVSQYHLALGSKGRSGGLFDNFSASFGPVGPDGYPIAIWDHETGRIDKRIANAWRAFDLRAYLEQHWSTVGAQLAGKLRFFCGEADNYALNQAMYDLQKFLESAAPSYGGFFYFARPGIGHQNVYTHRVLLSDMLRAIAHNAPPGFDLRHLHVPPASLEPLHGN